MTREELYTIRWYVNNASKEVVLEYIAGLLGENSTPSPELPSDGDPVTMKLAVVVGHEARAPGASFAGPQFKSEYDYNSKLAKRMVELGEQIGMQVKVFFRDGVGITGAYKSVKAWDPDCCIELHFNAFNGQAKGTVNLCSPDLNDKAFATIVQKHMCKAMKRPDLSRGLSILSKGGRGAGSVYALPGIANCLVEPFFGDNKEEAQLAVEQFDEYAQSLIVACQEWFSAN